MNSNFNQKLKLKCEALAMRAPLQQSMAAQEARAGKLSGERRGCQVKTDIEGVVR